MRLAIAFLLAALPAFGELSLFGFSATGTIHMSARITAGEYNRGNGQVNLWASVDWDADGGAGRVGTVNEGSVTFVDPLDTDDSPASITLRRIAKWDNLDRLIINTTGTGEIHNMFDEAGDPYRLTIVVESGNMAVVTTWTPPRSGGNASFIDWRASDGTMTDQMWTLIDSIAAQDSIIIAIHQGTATYTAPSRVGYVGDIEIIREYVGDVEIIGEYVGDIDTRQ